MKALLCLLLALPACVSAQTDVPPTTVPSVDLARYLGVWYELASIPQSFQKDCVANTTAAYSLTDDGFIQVLNSCDEKNGKRKIAEGRARVEDKKTNAKLKVTFVKLLGNWIFRFGGDYWVIDLAEDYSVAVVGHPTREYGWILSRTPSLSADALKEISSRLVLQGYDVCKFIVTKQAGGLSEAKPLCEVLAAT